MHHSDRGVQYACGEYRALVADSGLACSMSGKGDCYDNAAMESSWGTLKTELVYHERYATRAEAQQSIARWIESWYNPKRRHGALDYRSPMDYEAKSELINSPRTPFAGKVTGSVCGRLREREELKTA